MRAGSCFFWFAQGAGEAGRRPPAEGGHTGAARVGGFAAGPAARVPAPCRSGARAAAVPHGIAGTKTTKKARNAF